jgi:L-threonylcarbamoyladenylate synthase
MARVVLIHPERPDAGVIAEAAEVLSRGGLVAFPTETVYGLGARALDERAFMRIFEAKGRPAHHPLIAHVDDENGARSLARLWPALASRLAQAYWPGPLTLVVDRAVHVPAALGGGGDSIAVRAPSHAVARALIRTLGEPIAAPSANRYQGLSPTTAAHVVRQLGDAVDLVLDAGPCDAGIESTVVDVRAGLGRVLRPGALPLAALREVAPDLEYRGPVVAAHGASRASPGMEARHYAPRAKLVIAETLESACHAAIDWTSGGARAGLMIHERPTAVLPPEVIVRRLASEPSAYARELFSTLHEIDLAGVRAIVVQRVPVDPAWWAVSDRLERAAAV